MLSIQACPMTFAIYLSSGFIRPSQERVVTLCAAGLSVGVGWSSVAIILELTVLQLTNLRTSIHNC